MAAVAVLSAAAAAAALLCARPRPTRHQLVSRMAPNTKGSGFEWKDPTSIYLHGEAFAATVDVLLVRPPPPLLAPGQPSPGARCCGTGAAGRCGCGARSWHRRGGVRARGGSGLAAAGGLPGDPQGRQPARPHGRSAVLVLQRVRQADGDASLGLPPGQTLAATSSTVPLFDGGPGWSGMPRGGRGPVGGLRGQHARGD